MHEALIRKLLCEAFLLVMEGKLECLRMRHRRNKLNKLYSKPSMAWEGNFSADQTSHVLICLNIYVFLTFPSYPMG